MNENKSLLMSKYKITPKMLPSVCWLGKRMNDNILNLMALRYGASSGNITLESFISLVLRFDSMNRKYI